jgi:glutamate synthase domain-containing protein 2
LASNAGLPLKQSLAIADRTLRQREVRDNVTLFASGKIATPVDVALAMASGADVVGISRGFLFSLGCIQTLRCHKGDCPTGICTQSKWRQKVIDLDAASDRVATYAKTLMKETQMLAESCGHTDPSLLEPGDVMIQVEPGRFEYLSHTLEQRTVAERAALPVGGVTESQPNDGAPAEPVKPR